MSGVDALIAEHCPDGVVYLPLWQLTTWDKRFDAVDRIKQPSTRKYRYLLAKEVAPLVVEGGDVKILTTNDSDLWTTEEIARGPIHHDEIVAIPGGGNAFVHYYNGRFITSDNRIAVASDPSKLHMKFLYYFLLANLDTLASFYRGSGINHPTMADVLDWRIPVPPIEVQREIASVLDQFTQLEAELEAELRARKVQFAFYRDLLIDAVEPGSKRLPLSAIAIDFGRGKSKHRPRNDPRLYGGEYPFIQTGDVRASGHMITKYSQTYNSLGLAQSKLWPRGTICITIAANIAETGILDFDSCFPDSVIGLVVDPTKASTDYVEYLLQSLKEKLAAKGQGSAQANINLGTFENELFPFPAIEEQQRIVGVLDQLNALVNDFTIGLPAELAARRRQYEYYRGKLLTFKEAAA